MSKGNVAGRNDVETSVSDLASAAEEALRTKLLAAREKIVVGKRTNMLDRVADGVCDAIDAIIETGASKS